MEKFWCPVCDQGWVLAASVKQDGTRIWVREECEVTWLGAERPSRDADDTFSTFMESKGLPALWSQIEVLST